MERGNSEDGKILEDQTSDSPYKLNQPNDPVTGATAFLTTIQNIRYVAVRIYTCTIFLLRRYYCACGVRCSWLGGLSPLALRTWLPELKCAWRTPRTTPQAKPTSGHRFASF